MDIAWLVVTAGGTLIAIAVVVMVAPGLLRSSAPKGVVALTVAGAVLGVLTPGAATRVVVLDAVVRGCFGAICALAGATVGPRTRLIAATVVAIPPFLAPGGGAFAMVALGAAVAGLLLAQDGAVLGAAIGLAVGQAALRLGWPQATGLTALVAVVALLVLVLPALTVAPAGVRRRLLGAVALLGGVTVVVVGAYAVAVLMARQDVNAGVDLANAGLAAAREGDTAEAARKFADARAAFADARDAFDAWWAKPVLAVPVASQQARALSRMSAIGVQLAASGADVAQAADPGATELRDGTVPLAKIAALEAPLTGARRSLRQAGRRLDRIEATWLVGPVDDKLATLREEVAHATRDAETGVLAARVVPRLLGADGRSVRYFVAFQTPAEQRASGGIIGNFSVIEFTDGKLRKVRAGRDGDLNTEGLAQRVLSGPADYLARYAQFEPESTWQNVTMSPDWPSVAEVIGGLYPQSGGEPVDGVISVDPIALGAFLELTGPVEVDGLDEPLTSDNAARILLRDQYTMFPDLPARTAFLDNAINAVIDRLQTGTLPGAARIGEVLGPMVRQGRIKLQSVDPDGEEFVRRIGASGRFPAVRGDFVGLVTQNASGNKIELFLRRSVRYDVSVDARTRTAHAVATITLHNDAPTSGLPDAVIAGSGPNPTPPGHYRGYVSVYTPLALQRATVDGLPAPFATSNELGRNVLSAFVDIESGGSATIRLELAGPVRMPAVDDEDRRYRLRVWHQPTIEPDRVVVRVTGADGTSLSDPHGLRERNGGYERRARPSVDLLLAIDASGP